MRSNIILEIFVLIFLEGIILCSSHPKLQSKVYSTTKHFKRGINSASRDKEERNVINSFLNAWNTRLQPQTPGHKSSSYRDLIEHKRRPDSRLFRHPTHEEIWNKILTRKRGFDTLPDINLDNVFNPRPIKRKSQPTGPIATTYIGESVDDDDETPQQKLATLISKPIYHDIPNNVRKFQGRNDDPDNLRRFMYENTKPVDGMDNSGYRNEDFIGNAMPDAVPRQVLPRKYNDKDNVDNHNDEQHSTPSRLSKRYNIFRRGREYNSLKRSDLLDKIFDLKEELLGHQKRQKRIKQSENDKRELVSEPYYSIPHPVSESAPKSDFDRQFYNYHTDTNFDGADDKSTPFKLQKQHLWGRIEKRWKRNGARNLENQDNHISDRPVVRSLYGGVGETGNSFDAYGGIGQDISQTLVKLNPDSEEAERVIAPCKQNAQLGFNPDQGPIVKHKIAQTNFDPDQRPIDTIHNTDQFFFNANQEIAKGDNKPGANRQKDSDSGILKVEQNGKKTSIWKNNKQFQPRRRRAVLAGKLNHRSAQKQRKGLKNSNINAAESVTKKRYFDIDEVHGLPDNRPTENEEGIFEDDEHGDMEDKLARDSTPYLMKIAQHDRDDMHKLWNNKHSAGNGFYAGHGEGPNNPYLGDYFGHDPGLIEKDEGIRSLESSPSVEDHRTASIIDSIWEHDNGEEHVGTHNHEGHPGGDKVQSYFGHHDLGVLLPTETLEGFGNIPHFAPEEPEQHQGHPIDYAPTHNKAIQAIQDDPSIDSVISSTGGHHSGVGIEIEHHLAGLHHDHGSHHDRDRDHDHDRDRDHEHDFGMRHDFNGGMPYQNALVNDPVHVDDSHEEEYKQHIDELLHRYHGLEERLRGTEGTLTDHLSKEAFHHHGHNNLHSGYDMYAYKNPWENAYLPYHIQVDNHPWDTPDAAAPMPIFLPGGKGEEGGKGGPLVEGGKEEGGKGGPLVEGGKEEGGKGGPLVEGGKSEGSSWTPLTEATKASKEKNSKEDKDVESPKGAKENSKLPPPVIPEQRGGPELSAGKPDNSSLNSVSKDDNSSPSTENTTAAEKAKQTVMTTLLSSSDRQSKLVNELQEALKMGSKRNKGIASMQLAKLVQLNTLQQALIKTLASPLSESNVGSESDTNKVVDVSSASVSETDEPLEQLGKNIKPNQVMQFINALKENNNLIPNTHHSEDIPGPTVAKLFRQPISSNRDIQHRQLSSLNGRHLNSIFNNFGGGLNTKSFFSPFPLKNTQFQQKNMREGFDSGLIERKLAQMIQLKHDQQRSNTKSRIKQAMLKHDNYHHNNLDLAYSSIGNSGTVRSDVRLKNASKREKTMSKPKEELRKRHKLSVVEQGSEEQGVAKTSIVHHDQLKIEEENLTKKGIIKKI